MVRLLEQAQAEGSKVLIVSASIDNWVQPFFPSFTIVGTQIEVIDGLLTGRFLTPNCYGQEKVRRILALHPDRSDYHLIAYGDSRGDREMLAFADEAHIIH
jgi:HAD superfamily phosphoserine phosphatase-like hydrolase